MTSNLSQIALALFFCVLVEADISHFFADNYGYYSQQQPAVPSLYPVPPALSPSQVGDAFPTSAPASPPQSTNSPVAPVRPSSTTELTLPEIVENRVAKSGGRINFIPLQNQYLTPEEGRPNFEASKRPPSFGVGYFYPRPTSIFIPTTTTTTTSTTTMRPDPIVVIDPPDILPSAQAPAINDPVALQPAAPGYDYNVPAGPPFQLPTHAPVSTPAPAYLPQDDGALDAAVTPNTLRLSVHEMRCMQHNSGYFRAVLKVDSFIGAAPIVDNDSTDKRCELKLSRSYVVTDIAAEDFEKCGVHACGNDLCLRLRFPTIRGMRTSADGILTLHCKTQERVAVKTHALKVSVSNELQARSLGTYAHGGTQLPFRTHVELFRRTDNGFTRHLDTHSAVLLGEELLLRAHAIAGDGWNSTKLTDVHVQRISATGELLNNVALVTKQGCINPSMQSVCTQPPSYDPPLGHRLTFKAVMFQGMRSGDELVLSMRITGCLEERDCHVDASNCSPVTNLWRHKRHTVVAANGNEVSEISRIAFRVMLPNDEAKELLDSPNDASQSSDVKLGSEHVSSSVREREHKGMLVEMNALKIISAVGFVLALTGLGIFAAVKLSK
ncbi:PREDICTED: uncharacterized protein LOC108973722 [Bactrocera latifrons]|uniref:uncharacterized protein LOC108973722 n=1 Tax=Bactrocera latifrons TaxID=174628 RepID=UPI0008DE9A32|nr:PREDICTED: uncharacterized protein LOC108973722 [Bactrocera latifrons]